MTRLLVLGNSHSAALRIALRDAPERWPGFRPDVFAMPGNTLGTLELRDGALHPPDDDIAQQMRFYNRLDALPLQGYDAFVVIGGLAVCSVAGLQDRHRSGDFPSVVAGGGCRLVSAAFMDAIMRDRINASAGLRIIRKLAGLGRGPVLFIDQPFPSAECRADPQSFAAHVAMAGRGDGAAFLARYLRLLEQALGDDAIHVPQPAQTVVDHVFTAPEWMRGSVRMNPRRDVPHETAEYGHANPAYGALQADQIVAAL